MSRAEDTQALRDAFALVLASSHAFEGGAARFTELTEPYGLNEQQHRLVRMLAAVASRPEGLEDLEGFALYMAGRDE
jgi:hypothetical protein